MRQLAIDDVQIGAADTTRPDTKQKLSWARRRNGNVGQPQSAPRMIEEHGFHTAPCGFGVNGTPGAQ